MQLYCGFTDPKRHMLPRSQPPPPRHQRLMHLDALRGLFLLMMAMDHIPSDLQVVTNHPWGFVSAAEGFVFLAGLMAGLIYTRKAALTSLATMAKASRRRAGNIYLWHCATFAIVAVGVWWGMYRTGAAPGGAPLLMAERPAASLLAGASLLYQPGLLDILPLYCLLFGLLPLALRLLEAGRRRLLLLTSVGLWAVTNAWWPQQPLLLGDLINTGALNVGAWQLLFVGGVTFGHAQARGESLLPAPRAWLIGLVLLAAALLWANRRGYLVTGWPPDLHHWLTNKNNLAPLRLVNVILLFYLGYVVLSRFPRVLHIAPLAFLGRHSIAVFSAHVLVAYTVNALPHVFAATSDGRWSATVIMLIALFLAAIAHAAWTDGRRAPQPINRRSPTQPWRDIRPA